MDKRLPDPSVLTGSLSLAEKAAQVLVTAFTGRTAAEFETWLRDDPAGAADWEVPPGGVIIYGPNLAPAPATAGHLRALVDALRRRAAASHPGLPDLLVSIDHEGGRFTHLHSAHGFTDFPGNMPLGAIRDGGTRAARQAARAMAAELSAVGINLDYAPVVDVNCNPANPIIGERSFGENPQTVAVMGESAGRGFVEGGVLPCAKHFPGHGDTQVDSHLDLPLIDHPLHRLRAVELVPFVRAIRSGMPAIMTAHIIFPALAPSRLPATLSEPVLVGLLRRDLGFGGAIITDALEMNAISERWGIGEAVVATLAAGADIALVSHEGQAATARKAILAAVSDGRLPAARLDEAVWRVLTLRAKATAAAKAAAAARARSTGGHESAFDAAAHRLLAASIAARATTLVRDDKAWLPLDPASPETWLVVTPVGALTDAIARRHPRVRELRYAPPAPATAPPGLPRIDDPAFTDLVRSAAARTEAAIVATRATGGVAPGCRLPAGGRGIAAAVGALLELGRPVIWLSLGTPYELLLAPGAPAYLAAYSTRPPSLEAAAAVITGQARPAGKLPVSLPGLYRAGHGLLATGRG